MYAAAVARRRPACLEDMPLDVLECMCLHFLPPASFAALLCTSHTLRAALCPSAALWYAVARDVFGLDAAAKRGPLDVEEMMGAARTAKLASVPQPGAAAAGHAGGGRPAVPDGDPLGRPPAGGWTPVARALALWLAREAEPMPGSAAADAAGRHPAQPSVGHSAAVDSVGAAFASAFAWASRAAPVACATHQEAVQRYNNVVGQYGSAGARAARVWARLERFLESTSPVVLDTLLPGWRAPPPPNAVDPSIPVCQAVAASAALHLGQVLSGGSIDQPMSWVNARLSDTQGLDDGFVDAFNAQHTFERRRLAAEYAGLAGARAVYNRSHSGFIPPLFLIVPGAPGDRGSWFVAVAPPERQAAQPVLMPLDPATLRPFLVTASPGELTSPAPPMPGRALFVSLVDGAIYGLAASGERVNPWVLLTTPKVPVEERVAGQQARPPPPPVVLVQADAGRGILGWLEELASRMEAGLYTSYPAALLLDAATLESDERLELRPRGAAAAAREACLSGFPRVPLERADLGPADLAALAASWPDAGVGVALTGGVLQIASSIIYSGVDAVGGVPCHNWTYQLTMRLLRPRKAAGDGTTDQQATWPMHIDDSPGLQSDLPDPPPDLPPLRAARLVSRRWITRNEGGQVVDRVEGPGVIGLEPTLVAGAAPPFFSYASRTGLPAALRVGAFAYDLTILPGSSLGSMEGAFLFEGVPVAGGPVVEFWARTPALTLRVPEWRF